MAVVIGIGVSSRARDGSVILLDRRNLFAVRERPSENKLQIHHSHRPALDTVQPRFA